MDTLKNFFCMCLLIATAIQANPATTPSIEVSAKQLQISAGESASVTCTPRGNPLPSVQWSKHGGVFGAGTRTSGNTLTIGDAQAGDRGYYVCVGTLGTAVVAQKYVAVEIKNVDPSKQGDPRVIVSQKILSIPQGGSGSIDCIPQGNPLPKVRWIKTNGELRSGVRQNGNMLRISDARKEDDGDYVCQGIVDGTVIRTDYARVKLENVDPSARSNLKVTVSQRTLLIPRGGRGTVECTPEGHPLPTVQWIKSDGEFREGIRQSGNTLIISDAQEEDRGHYVCQGTVDGTVMITDYTAVEIDNADPPVESNLKVTVSQRTLLIPRGGRGTIECTPEGYPLPSVQWIKSDGEFRDGISQSGNTLIISDARVEDRGHYVCQGIVDGTVMLTNYTAVEIDTKPATATAPVEKSKVEVSIKRLKIPAGKSGSVTCNPGGNPLPSIQWRKHGGEFGASTSVTDNTLTIADAQEDDRGYYICVGVVGNAVIAQNYVYVEIERIPQTLSSRNLKLIVSEQQLRIPEGENGTIDCTPEGDPLPTVQWIKSDGEFPDGISQSGNTLIISDAREEDRGHYVCQGIVDGTVMLTNYSSVDIETNEDVPQTSSPRNLKIIVSERQLRIPKGENGTIECTPDGDPLPTVQWIKSGGEFRDGVTQSGNTLIISDAREEDRGHYVCQGVVDGTVMLTNYTAVDIEINEGKPDELPNPVDVVIPENTDFKISCDFETGDVEQNVTWSRRDQGPLPQNAQETQDLVIQSARKEDSGDYVCKVNASRGGFLLRILLLRLEVLALPLVSVHPSVQTVARGEAVTVECVVDGDGAQVTWDRVDGSSSRVEKQGSKLYLNRIEVEDAGFYRCSAQNRAGVSTGIAQIIVKDELQTSSPANLLSSKVIVSQRQLTIHRGQNAFIECTPEGNPLPTVLWIKSNSEFRDGVTQSGNTLIISDAREEDRGDYVCQGIVDATVMVTDISAIDVKNDEQTNSRVQVNVRQLTIPKGGNGAVECIPEGNPLPTVLWIKSNGEFRDGVTQSGNTLIISDAREEDRGDYVCQGIVDGTVMVTDYSAIDVKNDERPPVVAGNSRVQVDVRQLTIPKGGNGAVECVPKGNPLPTVQWSKYEGEFGFGTRQSGNTLIISDAQEQDGGYYVCDGMVDGTPAWTDYLTVEIESTESITASVVYPRVTVSVRHLRIPRGGTTTIECTAEGSPLPTVLWSKEGGDFGVGTRQSGNSLVISDAQEADRGNFVCSAVVDGQAVFSDYLTVEIQYICELPQEVGECRAALDRWFYDSTQQKCQKFTWGGCGGNKNNFETEEQCSLECESMLPTATAA